MVIKNKRRLIEAVEVSEEHAVTGADLTEASEALAPVEPVSTEKVVAAGKVAESPAPVAPAKVAPKPLPVDLFIELIEELLGYRKDQARNIISGIIPSDDLAYDIIRVCLRIRELEKTQRQFNALAHGVNILHVKDGSWEFTQG